MSLQLRAYEVALDHRLLDAARRGETTELEHLLDAGRSVELATPTGDSLLILAALHDRPDVVDVLLERGADPGRVNNQGVSALVAATFRGSTRIVRSLVDHGADRRPAAEAVRAVTSFHSVVTAHAHLVVDHRPANDVRRRRGRTPA
jgi:ankyrin repeat protein